MSPKIIVLICLIISNIIAVVVTIHDKRAARKGAWRVKESYLMFLALFGGSVAMLLTMKIIRHKTKHAKFMVGIQIIIICQVAVILFIIFAKSKGCL
jgi:uncharacterized membrane protein YsdA (DUF1294 family)